MSSTYQDLIASTGTSCQVQQDKSAYWVPVLYFIGRDGVAELVQQVGGQTAVHYFLNGDNIRAFPRGFQMIAGDSSRRSFTLPIPDPPASPLPKDQVTQEALAQKAVGFNCLTSHLEHVEPSFFRHFLPEKSFPDKNCDSGVRFELLFPSCWNGEAPDSPDHKSHVAYPSLTGVCPPGFPTRLIGLFYETTWNTSAYKNRDGRFVISNGDPTGYGYHGDFMTGWDPDFLQRAVEQCTSLSGKVEDCPLFVDALQSPAEQQHHTITIISIDPAIGQLCAELGKRPYIERKAALSLA